LNHITKEELNDALENLRRVLSSEISQSIISSRKNISDQINSELTIFVKDLINKNNDVTNEIFRTSERRLKDEISSSFDLFKNKLINDVNEYKQSLNDQVDFKIKTSIQSEAESFTKILLNFTLEQHDIVMKFLESFKDHVQHEINKKVVDKDLLESKFLWIEQEMKNHVGKIISFQVDQARNMMEQRAKEEIKQLSGEIKKTTDRILQSIR
jgi:hypothetical protein